MYLRAALAITLDSTRPLAPDVQSSILAATRRHDPLIVEAIMYGKQIKSRIKGNAILSGPISDC